MTLYQYWRIAKLYAAKQDNVCKAARPGSDWPARRPQNVTKRALADCAAQQRR